MRGVIGSALVGLLSLTAVQTFADDGDQAPKTPKKWTVLVYINGNNNLDSFGSLNINQMEQIGSSADVNVLVEWASKSKGETNRLLVKKDNDNNMVTSPIVQKLGKVDMGDYKTVVDFVKWGVANYPAEHYMVDIWDHGSGWHLNRGEFHPADISWDDNTGHHITTAELAVAMKESAAIIGHKVDIYASDACLMAMAEIAQEMADSVAVFAGSEETEPGEGWSYADFLRPVVAKPTATPIEVSQMLSKSYLDAYNGGIYGHQDVTFSAFDLSQMPAYLTAVKDLGAALNKLSMADKKKVIAAISNSENFTYSDYVDVADFLSVLQSANITAMDSEAVASLKKATSSLVVYGMGLGQHSKAKGLSMWIPASSYAYTQYADRYSKLKFDMATGWGMVLKNLLAASDE